MIRRGVAIVLLAASSWGVCGVASRAEDTLVHQQAPVFEREDLLHHRIDLAAYRGQVVLLAFWATWCGPCLLEIPHFVAWQKHYGPEGLAVISVSMDDDSAPVLALMRKRAVNYPVIMGDERIGTQYGGVLGLPVAFLIDRQGVIAARFQGETEPEIIEARMQELLRGH